MKKRYFLLLFLCLLYLKGELIANSNEFGLNLPKINQDIIVLIQSESMANNNPNYNSIGSGFWYRSQNNIIFLVTAKHVIIKDVKNDETAPGKKRVLFTPESGKIKITFHAKGHEEEVTISYLLDLNEINKVGLLVYKERDLIAIPVLKVEQDQFKSFKWVQEVTPQKESSLNDKRTIVMASKEVCKTYDEAELTSDVIFYGFPSSLSRFSDICKTENQIDSEWPLFRKGIIAGKNTKKKTIIIDGEVYEGNSGGPVFLILQNKPTEKNFFIIGVVTQFIPYVSLSSNERGIVTNLNMQNSGYSIVEPIENIINLIESVK